MAYRAPRYSYLHAARDTGGAVYVTVSDTEDPDFTKDNLFDDRAGTLFKWSASVVDPTITVDLNSGIFPKGFDRVIVPPDHTITRLSVTEDDNSGFSTPTTLLADTTAPVPGELIDLEFDTPSTERYLRLNIIGTNTHRLPQLVFTRIETLTVGPVLADALDGKQANAVRLLQPTGRSPTIQNGPQQRALEYLYEFALSGADLTTMEAMIAAVGVERPFWVDPASFSTPPSTDEPVLWMKFQQMPESRYTVAVPMSGTRAKTFKLALIESLD